GADKKAGPAEALSGRLIRLIVSTVAPDTWGVAGGRGEVDYYPLGMVLVVSQTPEVHEQVAQLLDSLRRAQDTEVAVQVRLVTLDEVFFRRVADHFGIDPRAGTTKVTFLKDAQLYQLFEAFQADNQTSVMQAPRITMLNGQEVTFRQCDSQSF